MFDGDSSYDVKDKGKVYDAYFRGAACTASIFGSVLIASAFYNEDPKTAFKVIYGALLLTAGAIYCGKCFSNTRYGFFNHEHKNDEENQELLNIENGSVKAQCL